MASQFPVLWEYLVGYYREYSDHQAHSIKQPTLPPGIFIKAHFGKLPSGLVHDLLYLAHPCEFLQYWLVLRFAEKLSVLPIAVERPFSLVPAWRAIQRLAESLLRKDLFYKRR